MIDDITLLRRYAANQSEDSFAELVRRYMTLVYSSALRRTNGRREQAADVTQMVFATLARHAGELTRHTAIVGWLYTATRNAVINVNRAEERRRNREREAHTMNEVSSGCAEAADWQQLQPVLDSVMDQLDARDREAVLLRFFEGRLFAEIASVIGGSEDAARKRVDRALEKLRIFLKKRNVVSTAAALALILANQPAVAVPPGLIATVSASAIGSAVPAASAFSGFALTTGSRVVSALVCGLVTVGAVMVFHKEHVSGKKAAVAQLVESEPIARSRTGIGSAKGPGPRAQNLATNAGNAGPLFGLRAIESFQNRGRSSPIDTFETEIWARSNSDIDALTCCAGFTREGKVVAQTIVDGMSPEVRAQYGSPERMAAMLGASNITHFTQAGVVSQTEVGPGQVDLEIQFQYAPSMPLAGQVANQVWRYQQTSDGWQRIILAARVTQWARYFKTGRLGPISSHPDY